MRVVYPYSALAPINHGYTLSIPAGTPVVAAGDGKVDLVTIATANWLNDLGITATGLVRIDHGLGIKSYFHGLVPSVNFGTVSRGQLIGYTAYGQSFFGLEINGNLQDPASVNPSFGVQDGNLNPARQGFVRQAPDLVTSTVTDIAGRLLSGIRYFFPPTPATVRFNLDFNGQGNKTGPAVIGAAGDQWMPVAPLAFSPTIVVGYCAGGETFPAPMGFFLNDYSGTATRVFLQRLNLVSNSGLASLFDPMLSSWVGGFSGLTALVNSFNIRNLPGGTYDLYVYGADPGGTNTTNVYVSVGGGAPTVKTYLGPGTSFVENTNYVHYSLSIPSKGLITLVVYGYLAGLQLQRS